MVFHLIWRNNLLQSNLDLFYTSLDLEVLYLNAISIPCVTWKEFITICPVDMGISQPNKENFEKPILSKFCQVYLEGWVGPVKRFFHMIWYDP